MEDELALVERAFLRIGSTSTDDALQSELNKLLQPLLLKLSSDHESVRKKVMELLIHINRRVKDHHHIQLPVEALIQQYQKSSHSFVMNFTIIYIKMGYPRLDINKQVELLPSILNSLEDKPAQHQDGLLLLLMPVFGQLKIPETPEKTASLFQLRERPEIRKLLLDFMMDILLLPYGATPLSQQTRPPEGSEEAKNGPPVFGVPAGMNIMGFNRVMGDNPPKPEELEKLKLSIVKFLSSEVITPSSVAVPLIVAAADTRFSVANAADMAIRRMDASIDWNSNSVYSSMYLLFIGTLVRQDQYPPAKFKNPANTRIRLKLMPYLLKSKEAANMTPLAVKVFFECVWGKSSNAKLRQQGVSFLHHTTFSADVENLSTVGTVLFDGVVKVIDEEKQDIKLRSLAYGALAKLSLKLPKLLLSHSSQLYYLQILMDALTQEEGDVLLALQEALSMVAPVCKELSLSSKDQLCVLLSDHVLHHNPQLRRTAVHYAATVFPSDHVPSRYILMIATGDNQDDIRLEARRQLYKSTENKDGTVTYNTPSFKAVVTHLVEKVNNLSKLKWKEVANQPIPYSVTIMEQMIHYLEHCLSVQALGVTFEEDQLFWKDSPKVGKLVRKIMNQHMDDSKNQEKKEPSPFHKYIGFAELASNAWSAVALAAIIRVVAVAPDYLASYYTSRMDWIRKFILRGGRYGEVAAHLFGVVAGEMVDVRNFEKAIQNICSIKELRIDSQESCYLAQGHSFGYVLSNMKKKNIIIDDWEALSKAINNIILQLLKDNQPFQNALVIALGEIARQTSLPIPIGEEKKEGTDKEKETDDNSKTPEITMLNLINALSKIFSNQKLPSKVREQAITTLGYLCVGQSNMPHKKMIVTKLLDLGKETNEIEVHFSIGEALTDCALGSESTSARNLWTDSESDSEDPQSMDQDSEDEQMEKDSNEVMEKAVSSITKTEAMDVDESDEISSGDDLFNNDLVTWLLIELLEKYIPQSHPNVRQASCMWLLTVLKRCRNKSPIQKYLTRIQEAFMGLLADNNDMIQDAASKGLGVVYECCTEATRQSMVEELVLTLTEGKRSVTNVTKETKIFQEGELGAAPSGGKLSTYKELCSLATDLNQPDLVYKFMNLANHNSIWNSRKGAAFGFGTLASQAGSQLEPYLPQIIPKLFRYQHDPTPKIQQPMASIWNALVTDSTKTIDKYYEPILVDLLTNLTNTTWRVRESSCHGLTDLLRRKSISNAIQHVEEMWTTLIRVRDDIKESVRLAADKTLNALCKSCIKVCEGTTEEGQKLVQIFLPILLTTGITSNVAEVRTITLDTLVKLCKSGGSLVKPHLGTLVPSLLEALSGLESRSFSYTAVRVNEEDREMLDTARVALAKGTPMMGTLNHVLQYVDDEVLESVVSGVIDILKRSVGLSSKAGAAHVVETLTLTCPGPLEKYSAKILAALVNGLTDRNPVVRRVYANAIGNLVKTAKSSSIEKLITKLQTWYLEKEEDSVKMSGALTLRSMHSLHSDIMKNYATQAMPLAFLAMHAEKTPESDPTGAEIWEEIWSENTPGTQPGVRLYLDEIIEICDLALKSSNWGTKAQAGRALSTVSLKLGHALSSNQVTKLVNLLILGLQGRTWTGKESLATALSNVVIHAESILKDLNNPETGEPLIDEILKVLTREATKDKMEYKIHAIKALSTVLGTYKIDRFESVFDICLPYVMQSKEKKEEEEDEERNQKEESLRWDLIDEMVLSLGRAWPPKKDTQEKYSERVLEMLNSNISRVPRKTQLSIVDALKNVLSCHFILEELPDALDLPLVDPLINHTCRIFNYCLGVAKFYSLRREALQALEEFANKAKVNEILIGKIKDQVLSSVEEAKRDTQPDIQAIASTINKILVNTSTT